MRRPLLALLLVAAGCDVVPPPTSVDLEPTLQLNALLRAGADTVAVLIERTGTEDDVLRTSPVSGARVRLAGPGGEVVLREAPAGFAACVWDFDQTVDPPAPLPIGPGCYAGVVPGGVRAGAAYSLAADLPGGAVVTARTDVPLPPEPVQPGEGARIVVRALPGAGGGQAMSAPLTLRWRTQHAREQVVPTSRPGAVYRDGRAVPGAQCTAFLAGEEEVPAEGGVRDGLADSLVVRGQLYGCGEWTGAGASRQFRPLRPDSVEVHLHLTSLDTAYTRSREGQGSNGVRERRASVGVTGAYGMFVGLASVRRRMVFVDPGA